MGLLLIFRAILEPVGCAASNPSYAATACDPSQEHHRRNRTTLAIIGCGKGGTWRSALHDQQYQQ
jgi:hypothetical protein